MVTLYPEFFIYQSVLKLHTTDAFLIATHDELTG
jgi:hypothetical protein